MTQHQSVEARLTSVETWKTEMERLRVGDRLVHVETEQSAMREWMARVEVDFEASREAVRSLRAEVRAASAPRLGAIATSMVCVFIFFTWLAPRAARAV